jgi:hypothetical protein
MQAVATEPKLPHLNPKYLEDVHNSCTRKCTESQFNYILERIEAEVDVVTRAMINSADSGFGFLKLAIHPCSSPESMAIIYEKIINQTPWKNRPTAIAFVEAIDTLFKFSSKNQDILAKFQADNKLQGDKKSLLEAASELTVMYIARLVNSEKLPLAS